MGVLKAIEQEHNGYLFRSRQEARWSEFFRQINLPVYYEYQGFDLGEGLWYLPDFYIPKWRAYLEVKNPKFWDDARERSEFDKTMIKARGLYEQTNYKVIVCFGGFGSGTDRTPMAIYFPGFSSNILGCGLFGYGTFGTCNGVDVLHLRSIEPDPATIAACHVALGNGEWLSEEQWELFASPRSIIEPFIEGLTKEAREAFVNICMSLAAEKSEQYREHLIPLHSSMGFNFSMIKDQRQGSKIFSPFSDPLLCNFNAPYLDRFKPYTEAYKVARQLRFEYKNGKSSTNVL